MRIISGLKRGHKLITPRGNAVRPMTDKNRETIFNIILHSNELVDCGFELDSSIILDLFAGTGAFAFEAVSRGAKEAILVENDQYMIDIIFKNADKLSMNFDVSLLEKDATSISADDVNKNIDLVFIDPPYKKKLEFKAIKNLIKKKIVKQNTIIIVEQYIKESIITYDELELLRTKELGITRFSFYKIR
ncbi:16S rRNA (guanine(966)-N(2))-methyltransferase RsmD [Pelagibacteraceae bacterium]|nr:16S rRNA (guanine(966)-N(2))-methyltransferase RsmD [Pelagibacteraceae bacterium]